VSSVQIRDVSGRGFASAITETFDRAKGKLDMLMAVLPNNRLDTYSDVKVKCSVEYGGKHKLFYQVLHLS